MTGLLAHGLVQRANLPLPEWLFGWAAAVVLVVSFAALAVLWSGAAPGAGPAGARCRPASPALLGSKALEVILGAFGFLLLVVAIVAGYVGPPTRSRTSRRSSS